ncbi:alpha-ribazole phosphatase [Fulvivirga sp. M361]|uniref:alpha-ribazole phosphatase n=1 Tax=Fulvivirga sp. M361 TaxID=2594266 RepID=UPI001179B85C|nr:alpha-ribazole phosphatase [Fulvivirga sp. M361]TRX55528.1 alpha-ribazole phosphatase [Fulvivirga sp. M361]
MEIYLVRHTTPEVDKGVCYGQADLDVISSFQEEVNRLKFHLPKDIGKVYSSPLKRCKVLAQQLSDEISFDDRLKEMSFGDWELKKWDDIGTEGLNVWMDNFVGERPAGGESFEDLSARVLEFWGELINKKLEDPVILCIHGGVIRVIISHLLHIPLRNTFHFHLDYGSVNKIARHGDIMRVEYVNR